MIRIRAQSNILIGDDEKALIADFGLSHVQGQVSSRRGTGRSNTGPPRGGSLRWMAPERLDGKPPKTPVDVYSFALTAWELYTGEVPFSRVLDSAMIVKVVDKKERPPRPGLMKNNTLWNLVKQSWHGDPLERPGFATLHVRLGSLLIQCKVDDLGFTVIDHLLMACDSKLSYQPRSSCSAQKVITICSWNRSPIVTSPWYAHRQRHESLSR